MITSALSLTRMDFPMTIAPDVDVAPDVSPAADSGNVLTLAAYNRKQAAEGYSAYVQRTAIESDLALAELELQRQRDEFTASVLDTSMTLSADTVPRLKAALTDAVMAAANTFIEGADKYNTCLLLAVHRSRSLGLVDDASLPVGYRTGVQSGLMVQGSRLQPVGGKLALAEHIAAAAAAAAGRPRRSA